MWLKYWNAPIDKSAFATREQPQDLSEYRKPSGCWITDDSEHCWRSWCIGEGFAFENLTHKHEVTLDENDILILGSAYELDGFTHQFATEKWWGPDGEPRKYRDLCIDWPAVARRYSGLIITPYQWARRLDCGYSWYYTWDCASGCIWNADAIKEIRLIDIDHDVVRIGEKAA